MLTEGMLTGLFYCVRCERLRQSRDRRGREMARLWERGYPGALVSRRRVCLRCAAQLERARQRVLPRRK